MAPGNPSMAIVEALVGMAAKLGMRVVAEGIETEDQADQLEAVGCVLGQGFLFSKAVDRAATAMLLRRHAQGAVGVTPMMIDRSIQFADTHKPLVA